MPDLQQGPRNELRKIDMALEIVKYEESYQSAWDQLVEKKSINGIFLQTRNFLNYHPSGRFRDASLMVMQGNNLVAVIPACDTMDEGKRCFFSHKGSTYGGIVVDEKKYNITTLSELVPLLDEYLKAEGYESVLLRCTPGLFSKRPVDLLDYFLFQNGYGQFDEVSFYVDLQRAPEDLTKLMSSSRRRDYRYSLKNELEFRHLDTDDQIREFHQILSRNLEKFHTVPVHTVEELLEFKNCRLPDECDFYGVYYQGKMVAGTMLFYFGKQVLHTQYLAQDPDYAELYLMNFLDFHLIQLAREKGYSKFSFGISTEERGKVLNKGLALFKEGFGCDFSINRSYTKLL